MVEPRQRNFHNKFFALLNLVFENQTKYPSKDVLLDHLKLEIGHCYTVKWREEFMQIPKSISYDACSPEEFKDFYDRAVHWVCSVVIPEMDEKGLEEAVREEILRFGD